MNISKELLSEVLGTEIKYFETDIKKINYHINSDIKSGNIAYFNIEWKYINIYELMHKMKEFILTEQQRMGTYYSTSVQGWCCWLEDGENRGIAKTELEAVMKACEWVLKQKVDKNE